MNIIWVFREIDVNHDIHLPSSVLNPNGGVNSKCFHLSRCLPLVKIVTELDVSDGICFCETLWFDEAGDPDALYARVEAWENWAGYKILANSDLALLRLPGIVRDRLIDSSDLLVATSTYGLQLFSAITPKVVLLPDPIDVDMFVPGEKVRELYGIGNVCPNKNIQGLIDIFSAIPRELDLKTRYIGSSTLWGCDIEQWHQLEEKLVASVNTFERSLPRSKVAQRISQMWAFLADSYYDMASFGMMEAMLAGCWTFVGRHLLYDERPCVRFNSTIDAVGAIAEHLNEHPPESGVINEAGRQYIVDTNGYDVFRKELSVLIGRYAYGI